MASVKFCNNVYCQAHNTNGTCCVECNKEAKCPNKCNRNINDCEYKEEFFYEEKQINESATKDVN